MRHIKRLSEPEILVKKKRKWTSQFINSDKKRPDSSKYAHHEIKSTLITMSHNKCFYCETILKGTAKEIDHLIEVSENKKKAYEWSNLFLSCDNCNKKIPNISIPADHVLNPCEDQDDEIQKHISFINEEVTFITDKGKLTIQKFKLNSERLDYLRLKQLQKFYEILVSILMAIKHENRRINAREREILQRFTKTDNCYSLMFQTILEKYTI